MPLLSDKSLRKISAKKQKIVDRKKAILQSERLKAEEEILSKLRKDKHTERIRIIEGALRRYCSYLEQGAIEKKTRRQLWNRCIRQEKEAIEGIRGRNKYEHQKKNHIIAYLREQRRINIMESWFDKLSATSENDSHTSSIARQLNNIYNTDSPLLDYCSYKMDKQDQL
jgi:hypothetical protein